MRKSFDSVLINSLCNMQAIIIAFILSLLSTITAQQAGTLTTEKHPSLNIQQCTAAKICTTISSSITLDASWRWLHSIAGVTDCYTGNAWNPSLCPDPVTCAKNCALDGADYSGAYGGYPIIW